MSDPTYDAMIYPQGKTHPTITYADQSRTDIGVCFSGGGSRALTCAWGQMIGLRHLSDGGVSLLDKTRYISSVSGGSWAAVLYTYLPASIPDDDFFPAFFTPQNLYLETAPSGAVDVSQMGPHAMGQVPQKFANLLDLNPFENIIIDFLSIILVKHLDLNESLQWLWMYIVGNEVLAPFGLYTYDFSFLGRDTPWDYKGAKYFSLSQQYANDHLFNQSQPPPTDDFEFVRPDSQGNVSRPMLVINTNIVGAAPAGVDLPIQIPVQVTPVSGGALGHNPVVPQDIVGGGSVDSFAFTSQLQTAPNDHDITADFPRVYSLVDITSASSAFFAETLAESVREMMQSLMDMEDDKATSLFGKLLKSGESSLLDRALKRLQSLKHDGDSFALSDFVPQYNYWPVAQAADGSSVNQSTQFTDGGDLENTGVLGMLAQTDVSTIIAFVNTSAELEKTADDVIVAVAQASPLFGIAFDSGSKQFKAYEAGGVNPFTKAVDPKGFLHVFDNTKGEFDALREALYQANGSGAQTGPAFCQQSLIVIGNELAGVAARSKPVTVLWAQNAQVNDWQRQIADASLRSAITNGQSKGGKSEFANFPYYSTFLKIHQSAAETNTLAQMWAWCVADPTSPLSAAIKKLF